MAESRRSARLASAGAATGGAAAGAATGGAGTGGSAARHRPANPFGKKLKFDEMKFGQRYLAIEKEPFLKGTDKQIISGVITGVYTPGSTVRINSSNTTLGTTSKTSKTAKPYAIMKDIKYEDVYTLPRHIYYIGGDVGKYRLIPIWQDISKMNKIYSGNYFLSSAHWDFYLMPITAEELLEAAPVLENLRGPAFNTLMEYLNPLISRR